MATASQPSPRFLRNGAAGPVALGRGVVLGLLSVASAHAQSSSNEEAASACFEESSPCETQLRERGWRLVLTGIDSDDPNEQFQWKILKSKNEWMLCLNKADAGTLLETPCAKLNVVGETAKD